MIKSYFGNEWMINFTKDIAVDLQKFATNSWNYEDNIMSRLNIVNTRPIYNWLITRIYKPFIPFILSMIKLKILKNFMQFLTKITFSRVLST